MDRLVYDFSYKVMSFEGPNWEFNPAAETFLAKMEETELTKNDYCNFLAIIEAFSNKLLGSPSLAECKIVHRIILTFVTKATASSFAPSTWRNEMRNILILLEKLGQATKEKPDHEEIIAELSGLRRISLTEPDQPSLPRFTWCRQRSYSAPARYFQIKRPFRRDTAYKFLHEITTPEAKEVADDLIKQITGNTILSSEDYCFLLVILRAFALHPRELRDSAIEVTKSLVLPFIKKRLSIPRFPTKFDRKKLDICFAGELSALTVW